MAGGDVHGRVLQHTGNCWEQHQVQLGAAPSHYKGPAELSGALLLQACGLDDRLEALNIQRLKPVERLSHGSMWVTSYRLTP